MKIIFFNINGSGLGHMNRCLAYARVMHGNADIIFFTLASVCEIIESFGYKSEYFVSPFWSSARPLAWNVDLAHRFGIFLNTVKPDIIIFDGTWPYAGFLSACKTFAGTFKLVWSRRGLMRQNIKMPAWENLFDLVLEPGELDTDNAVTLLQHSEILPSNEARRALGLDANKKYALFSLGPGNLKDLRSVGSRLLQAITDSGYQVCWALSPITTNDITLPQHVLPLQIYPIAKYLRAFDVFVGAAGYNTCCEVVQAQIPSLLVPNTLLADDQTRRANMVAQYAPAVVSACETDKEIQQAVEAVCWLATNHSLKPCPLPMDGAKKAADAILALAGQKSTRQHKLGSLYAHGVYAMAKVSDWLYKNNLPAWPAWSPALKHGSALHGKTLYLQNDLQNKTQSREACDNIKSWLKGLQFIPVLETGISDFAFYSRLGWLVEYLPNLDGNGAYVAQKKHYLAWRYKGAIRIPLSAGLGSKDNFARLVRA